MHAFVTFGILANILHVSGFAEVVGVLLGVTVILWCSRKWVALGGILIVGGCMCIVSWALPTEGKNPRYFLTL